MWLNKFSVLREFISQKIYPYYQHVNTIWVPYKYNMSILYYNTYNIVMQAVVAPGCQSWGQGVADVVAGRPMGHDPVGVAEGVAKIKVTNNLFFLTWISVLCA